MSQKSKPTIFVFQQKTDKLQSVHKKKESGKKTYYLKSIPPANKQSRPTNWLMIIKVYHIDLRSISCVKSTHSDLIEEFYCKKYQWSCSNRKKIRLQDGSYLPYWSVYLGCFHIEAPLYTTDHVSENTFDQTEINNRKIVVKNTPL